MSQNRKAADLVYDFIIEKIQQGEWLPDTRIWTEAKLSEELQISRVAVRDAIQRLSAMSVLRKVQGSGTFVQDINIDTLAKTLLPIASVSEEDMMAIMEFRIHFECGNINLFMSHCTEDEIRQLERNYETMVEQQDSPEAFYQADYEFHSIIARGTRNSFVSRISDLCMNALIAQHKHIRYTLGPSIGVEDHGLILKFIKERDVQLAAMHMQRHVQRILNDMSWRMKKTNAPDTQKP